MPKIDNSVKRKNTKTVNKILAKADNVLKPIVELQSVSKVLRKAIKECGVNPTALGKFCGVAASTIREFAVGTSSMSVETMDKVCRVLGLELVQTGEMVADNIPRGRPSGEVLEARERVGIPKYKDIVKGPVGRPKKVIEK